jgi:phenylpropionate dioxygenase-like ring-hydroxylating dioxygenase large terminal subunit
MCIASFVDMYRCPCQPRSQCSYHGWRFDGCGACAGVPQDAAGAGAAAARSPRSAALAFPTAAAQGLLFIFPCAAPDAAQAAATTPLPLLPGLDGAPGEPAVERSTAYVRDLPHGLDTLLENLSDPAHVAYAHHGVAVRRGWWRCACWCVCSTERSCMLAGQPRARAAHAAARGGARQRRRLRGVHPRRPRPPPAAKGAHALCVCMYTHLC